MRILPPSVESINEAAKVLSKGGVIIYPTDTVYGLGCNPRNVRAVKRIFEIKRRPRYAALPVLGASLADLERVCFFTPLAEKLANLFWPGPLTLVLRKKPSLSRLVTARQNSVGVRIPSCLVALEIMRRSFGVLIGTSANISGERSPSTVEEIPEELLELSDLCIDYRRRLPGTPSTVAKVTGNRIKISRKGTLGRSELVRWARR